MLKKILLASIFVITAITNVTHAEDDMKTVASKAYVDTKIETKQLKIPAAGQPNVGAGETVMTYTTTGNGQIGERGLYSDISSYDASTDGGKLITASALNATFTNLPTTDTTKLECANQADGCTLWTIVDQTAYGDMLPSGYTRLEYIESTGTQYIDTGYMVTNESGIKIVVDDTATNSPRATTASYFVGASLQGSYMGYFTRVNSGQLVSVWGWNGEGSLGNNIASTHSTVYINYMNDRKFIYNNGIRDYVRTNDLPTLMTADGSLYLFNTSKGGAVYRSIGKMYSAQITENETIIHNFVPAKRNSDDVIGMYDTVSGQFFTNAATSGDDFSAGPPVQ